jgi:hypothetical protein
VGMAVKGVPAMAVIDEGDDLLHVTTRGAPAFPWDDLRYILTLGGDYSSDTGAKQVPMSAHRVFDGIRWASLERAKYGPVMLSIQRAFNENRKRHNLQPIHWTILMACEVGLVLRTIKGPVVSVDKETGRVYQQVAERWCIFRPERQDHLMPYDEAARTFGLRSDLVGRYHGEAKRAIEDEWAWFHSGYEG